jgi:hypothetical protein
MAGACAQDVPPPTTSSPAASTSSREPSSTSPSLGPSASEVTTSVDWRRISAAGAGPAARSGHTWTVDPDLALAWLVGGRGTSGVLADAWEYDLGADTWRRLEAAGPQPPARTDHVAGWIDGLGLVVVGGTGADGRPLDDVWRLDPETGRWEAVDVDGARPPARRGACASVDGAGGLWLSHGSEAPRRGFADTWRLDPAARAWTRLPDDLAGPSERHEPACWWTPGERLVLAGGRTGGEVPLDDVWSLSGSGSGGAATWAEIASGVAVVARSDAAAARRGDQLVLVGGLGPEGDPLADVAVLDATSLEARSLGSSTLGPTPRAGATLIEDPAAERLLLFGGETAEGPSDGLWEAALP